MKEQSSSSFYLFTRRKIQIENIKFVKMKKVLIIDDDTRNVFALSAVLRSRGYKYEAATSPAEALLLLKNSADIGIVLMDMMMPEMDGYSLIPHIKEIPQKEKIPIVAVTAQAMTGDKEKCLAAGADDYLAKPIDIDKLLALLKTYLQ